VAYVSLSVVCCVLACSIFCLFVPLKTMFFVGHESYH
jgi:hypothetical protein